MIERHGIAQPSGLTVTSGGLGAVSHPALMYMLTTISHRHHPRPPLPFPSFPHGPPPVTHAFAFCCRCPICIMTHVNRLSCQAQEALDAKQRRAEISPASPFVNAASAVTSGGSFGAPQRPPSPLGMGAVTRCGVQRFGLTGPQSPPARSSARLLSVHA